MAALWGAGHAAFMNEPVRIGIYLGVIGNLDLIIGNLVFEIANYGWVIDDFRAGIALKTEAKGNFAAEISNGRGDIENFRFF